MPVGRSVSLVVALGVVGACTSAADVRVSPVEEESGGPIETDPEFTITTLDNGLTVYLRENTTPGGQVHIRLAVDAGSAAEGTAPSGTAHFLEHMLFNGTEQFPGNELVDVLSDYGSNIGPDVNAGTGYDDTVYSLTLPNRSAAIDTGLDVMAQWLSAATIDPAEVEAERGVITDEWRQSEQDISGRVFDGIESLFFEGSVYEGRDPIGTADDIAAISTEDLRTFYDRWYRPEHAALVVVGDIDADEMATEIEERFASITGRGAGGPSFEATWTPPPAPCAVVVSDPDMTSPFVELTLPQPAAVVDELDEIRRRVATGVGLDIIATRLADDIRRGDLDADEARVDDNSHVRALDAPTLLVSAGDEQLAAAADALVAEIERARRFGFGEAELARAVDRYAASADADYEARGSIPDEEWADEATDHFLVGELLVDAETRHRVQTEVLEGLDAEFVSSVFAARLESAPAHLLAGTSDGSLDEAGLLERWAGAGGLELEPREDLAGEVSGLMTAPEPVEEAERTELQADEFSFLSPVQLDFANGATVILNAEAISDGSVSMAAVSPGGSSVLPDDAVAASTVAVDTILGSGVGDLDAVEVDQVLGASSVEVFGGIDDISEYLYADIASDDLELTFQYLHQLMAAPRADQGALDRAIAALEPFTDGAGADQDSAGYVALLQAMYGDDPRVTGVPSGDQLAGITLAGVEQVWQDRFADAGGWVFVVVGDFELSDGEEFARRYIGTLPGARGEEAYRDVRVRPETVERVTVQAGVGDKAQLQAAWWADSQDLARDELLALLATQALDQRLFDVVREGLGATYSPSAYVQVLGDPTPMVETTIMVTGAPDGMAELSQVLAAEVERLRAGGVTEEEWDDALAAVREELGFVYQGQLLDVLLRFGLGEEQAIERYLAMERGVNDLERTDLQDFLVRVLPADRWVEVTVLPS